MSRVLVTGAAGFIGSHLCDALIARGDSVVGVDSFTEYYSPARKRANLADALATGLEFRRIDLTRDPLEPVVEGIDVVYHLAGQPGVRRSWGEDFDLYARRNLVATQRLLEATLCTGNVRFVFASSSSVYGNIGAQPARESDLTGRRALMSFSPPARGDASRTNADLTAARRDLDYQPTVSLREGLALQIYAAMDEPVELVEAVA